MGAFWLAKVIRQEVYFLISRLIAESGDHHCKITGPIRKLWDSVLCPDKDIDCVIVHRIGRERITYSRTDPVQPLDCNVLKLFLTVELSFTFISGFTFRPLFTLEQNAIIFTSYYFHHGLLFYIALYTTVFNIYILCNYGCDPSFNFSDLFIENYLYKYVQSLLWRVLTTQPTEQTLPRLGLSLYGAISWPYSSMLF